MFPAARQGSLPVPAQSKAPEAMMAMPLVAPLFLEGEGGFSSMVTVVNPGMQAQAFDFVVSDPTGFQVELVPMQMAPHSQKVIRLAEVLRNAGSVTSLGSIKVMPKSMTDPMPLAAQLSMDRIGEDGMPLHIEEEY
jgi:hypothetical protein